MLSETTIISLDSPSPPSSPVASSVNEDYRHLNMTPDLNAAMRNQSPSSIDLNVTNPFNQCNVPELTAADTQNAQNVLDRLISR